MAVLSVFIAIKWTWNFMVAATVHVLTWNSECHFLKASVLIDLIFRYVTDFRSLWVGTTMSKSAMTVKWSEILSDRTTWVG